MKVLVAAGVHGVNAHDVIQVHRRYMVELMQEWTRLKSHDRGDDLNFALVVDAELFRLDAVIRWLDAADGRISRAEHTPREPSEPGLVPTTPPLPHRIGARR
jgi:hypothetical protein